MRCFKYLAFILLLLFIQINCESRVAVAHLNTPEVSGSIWFTETEHGVRVHGSIVGLDVGYYGFHIHEFGDTRNCDATGTHFNPDDIVHGARDDDLRHVGDLGNIYFHGEHTPMAAVDFIDNVIALRGRNSILGRALVLHENEDDLGLGGHETSLTTGNAGGRVACAVIGLVSPVEPWLD